MSEKEVELCEALKVRGAFESKLIVKAWENEEFRKALLSNPREALSKELGQKIPENFQIEVIEETGDKICFVVPHKPRRATEDKALTDAALEGIAAGGFYYQESKTTQRDAFSLDKTTGAKFLFWSD